MPDFSFAIRAVQLDLARQMETLDFIRNFIDFAAESGFNTVTLYLEGRIRTASFPHPSTTESYSLEEMAAIVAHARSRNIEVMPVVSLLSHAELFLSHPATEPLAETRGSIPGRFGPGTAGIFCPSLDGTYRFLHAYLTEICAIFPAPYFHAGCDEAWDMACCDLCRARLQEGESQSDLFEKHLLTIHRILTGELGKRMIIWDDMFEYYPKALHRLPRDIIMACWQYQDRVEGTRSHFFNRLRGNAPATYQQLGFDFFICPADYTLKNAESFTAYAAKYKPLGALLTTWEKSDCFLLQSMPLIGCVGRRWHSGLLGDGTGILKTTAEAIFGCTDEVFLCALKSFCEDGLFLERRIRLEDFLTQGENISSASRQNLVEILGTILSPFLDCIKQSSRMILEEMILSLQSERLALQLGDLLPQFLELPSHCEKTGPDLLEIISALEAIAVSRVALWQKIRPGITPCRMETHYEEYLKNLREIPARVRGCGALKIHFFLPDQYSAQTVRIFIQYAGSSDYEKIASGVFKELRTFDCFFSRWFLIDQNRTPEKLRIETFGYGGQGFTFFEIHNEAGRFIPETVAQTRGSVTDPENLLVPDWQWTFVGERNTQKSYLDRAVATAVHGFDIVLRKRE